jgi:hypothetical protein
MLPLLYSLYDLLRDVTPVVLLVLGISLRFYAPHYQVTLEERIKNRQVTEAGARRALAFVRWSAPALTLIGIVLLGCLAWGAYLENYTVDAVFADNTSGAVAVARP